MSIQDMAGGSDGPAETSTATIETTASDGRHATITLHGDIEDEMAAALQAELQRHLHAGRCFIRINTGGVTFLDSSAVGALVTGATRCAAEHGELILSNVPTLLRRLIEITGLERVLVTESAGDEHARD